MKTSRVNALVTSFAFHAIAIGLLLALTTVRDNERSASDLAHYEPPVMVWLPIDGPGGGGGGGGDKNPDPPRAAELKGNDTTTMPVAPRPAVDAGDKPEPPPTQLHDVPAQTLGASDLTAMGLIAAGADSLSQGPGSGNGAGPGDGTGSGPGHGPGLGPGEGGNTGGRVYQPGGGVTMPVPVFRQQPRYTVQAMRARLEGEVTVQCVVLPSGECTELRIVRSLDARLGLDEEALRAAAGWRFRPGTRQGKAVPVLVTILVGFSIH